ncbi:MAG: HAMP domain-containing histidine kinase [Oscillospiraceae bacterium]|nr:HAMP domain-containing histidine kinase [Oscillospiraceae bacterium]
MRYRMSAWYWKLLAWLLAGVCLVFGIWSAYIALTCANYGMYGENTYQETNICRDRTEISGREVIERYRHDPDFKDWGEFLGNSQLRFIILEEETGNVTASYVEGLGIRAPLNLKDNVYLRETSYLMERGMRGSIFEYAYVCDYYFNDKWYGDRSLDYEQPLIITETGEIIAGGEETGSDAAGGVMHQVLFMLPLGMEVNDTPIGEGYEIWRMWNYWKDDALVCLAVCLLGLLVSCVFLCVQAGRRPGSEEVCTIWLDRVWLEVVLFVGALAAVGFAVLFCGLYETYYNRYLIWKELQVMIVLCDAGATACGLTVLGCCLTVITRLKAKCFWRSMLISRILVWIWKKIKKPISYVLDVMRRGFMSLGLVPVAVLTILGAILTELLLFIWLVNANGDGAPVVMLILYNIFVVLAMIWGAAQMKKLQQAAKALAAGDLEHHLDTAGMYWHFKAHGEDLNAIAGGMTKAVEQRMRSENLKTDLITNVSHDIKTPLTSIINYVDLLEKPHTEAEGIQYLGVLHRQALRLKKLTEDLVEASKASTGNIPVELEALDVTELLGQAVEEYRERLEQGQLSIVSSVRGDLSVLADGKLLWRVLDNLLGNVVKYAMSGTRVYVTAAKRDESVVISIKNISRETLAVDADDLMERFVRGDLSRNTEGSGLGLNIARDLVRLQNGRFDLTVDGDLFKVEIALPMA